MSVFEPQTLTLHGHSIAYVQKGSGPVLLLVHGSSPAALASFDLSVPGHAEFSLMNVFARLGYDVWTLDHEGYGRSSRTTGNSDASG